MKEAGKVQMEIGIASGTEWPNYLMAVIYSYERPTIHYAV